ncbi:MAG: glutamine amidotransferase-related protein [Akkermansia sp.]
MCTLSGITLSCARHESTERLDHRPPGFFHLESCRTRQKDGNGRSARGFNESPELEQAVQAGEKLILSPGPGTVEDACHRATFRLLDRLPRFTPVLGVCLGHQILGVRFEPVWNTFPGPFTERGIHTQDGAVSPSGRIAGTISCSALPFLAPCRFSLAG